MSISGTRSRAAWPPARARCWSVDAAQGVEAQTLANVYLALEHDLEIVPILNKIDLAAAEPERVPRRDRDDGRAWKRTNALPVSAKTGRGIDAVLEANRRAHSSSQGPSTALRCAPCSSIPGTTPYRGVIMLARVVDGILRKGHEDIRPVGRPGTRVRKLRISAFKPRSRVRCGELRSGEVGCWFATSKTSPNEGRRHTICDNADPPQTPLPGFEESKPMVFAGLYPLDSHEHTVLREALEKLQLNDRFVSVRAGKLRRVGIRLSLRIPGTAASRCRARAARARIRESRAHHHRPGRALPRDEDRRRDGGDR